MTTKDEIIGYVMKSPANTNRAVLNSMLEDSVNEKTVEIIKLGSGICGTTKFVDNFYGFTGSINIDDNKTVGEIIGNKTIINYGIELSPIQEGQRPIIIMGYELSVNVSNNRSDKSLNIATQEVMEQNRINVFGTAYLSGDTLYSVNVTAYAICI